MKIYVKFWHVFAKLNTKCLYNCVAFFIFYDNLAENCGERESKIKKDFKMKKTLADYRLLNAGLSAFKRLAEKAGFRKTKPQEQKPQEQKTQEQPIKQLTKEEIAQIEKEQKERELIEKGDTALFYLLMKKLVALYVYNIDHISVKPLDIGGWANCIGFRIIFDDDDPKAMFEIFKYKDNGVYFLEVPEKDRFISIGDHVGSYVWRSKETQFFIKIFYDMIKSGKINSETVYLIMNKKVDKDSLKYAAGHYTLELTDYTLPYLHKLCNNARVPYELLYGREK